MIILVLFVGSCSSLSYFFLYRGEVGKSNRELEKTAEKGRIIIDALEEYKIDNSEYPIELSSLYPKYISPDIDLVYEFSYAREDKMRGGRFTDEEIDDWGGYELGISNIKQWVFSPFGRTWYTFVYYPSELYPERKWEKPKKRVKDWALILLYRRYQSKENPIVGPGV
ncbi:MAG: hypothetical protein GY775_06515 [Candidatus Scalindua sp.]|nr:hypothetical protein [Candidatus Scalindua sp.]